MVADGEWFELFSDNAPMLEEKFTRDRDSDGLSDVLELVIGTIPMSSDSDKSENTPIPDGIPDYEEVVEKEYNSNLIRTLEDLKDLTDGEGPLNLNDNREIDVLDPFNYDSDSDSIPNGREILIEMNFASLDEDVDNDGINNICYPDNDGDVTPTIDEIPDKDKRTNFTNIQLTRNNLPIYYSHDIVPGE